MQPWNQWLQTNSNNADVKKVLDELNGYMKEVNQTNQNANMDPKALRKFALEKLWPLAKPGTNLFTSILQLDGVVRNAQVAAVYGNPRMKYFNK